MKRLSKLFQKKKETDTKVSVTTEAKNDETYDLILCNPPGSDEFSRVRDEYIKQGESFVLVYAVTDEKSFEELKRIRDYVLKLKDNKKVPTILVGSKVDLQSQREVPFEKARLQAKEWNVPFFETSARTGQDVTKSLHTAIRQIPKLTTERRHYIVFLGSPGVGKTFLIIKFISNRFSEDYSPTLEDTFFKKVRKQDLPDVWAQWERYLWIGHLKEKPTHCILAGLPKDLLREIAFYLQN